MQSNLPVDILTEAAARGIDARPFVIQVAPRDVSSFDATKNGFLFVYRDTCPFCRALRATAGDLVRAMAADDTLRTGKHVALYFIDSSRHGPFVHEALGVTSVPSIFVVERGRVANWPDNKNVATTRGSDGAIVKTLPIASMLKVLRSMARQSRLEAASSTARQTR